MSTPHDDLPVEYVRAGLALIQIPLGVKGPRTSGWQLEENAIRGEVEAARLNGGNIGLAHRWCGTCAVDVDDYQQALPWLAQRGIDLQALLLADDVVQIKSGKPNRAKLLYRLPDGVEWLPTHKLDGLELRCASLDGATTVQDVLPPSLHPDTGAPYEWVGDWRHIPRLPDALLKLWRELSAGYSRQGPLLGIEHDPVLAALDKHGMVIEQLHGKVGGWSVRCPWESAHTGEGGKADTAYFEPHTNGYSGSAFLCLHSHCANRGIRDLQAWLGIDTENATIEAATAKLAVDVGAGWPAALDPCAYYGIAGKLVKAIGPHTEADPAAILVQVLVAFGALIGRSPYVQVEGDRHYPNLFGLLIGGTSKGRKGTSWGRVRSIFERISSWPRVVSGLSSGEGLKWQVRDSRTEMVKNKKTGETTEEVVDEGVTDKRLLVIEPEFAQVLRAVARHGNTLSSTVRTAWDIGNLATLTKSDPVTATDAHIAIIAHVTIDELRAELTQTDTANGFANRFLFVCVKRSQCLPFGGEDFEEKVAVDIASSLEQAANAARRVSKVTMTQAARETWKCVYPRLSEGMPGLVGAATARGEAQALRFAMLYALLDEKALIDKSHLLAALAVCEYAQASALHVFGSSLGDPVADEILRAVRSVGQDGMTRTQIRDLFARNCSADRLGAALDLLARRNLVRRHTQETGGRPSEVWESIWLTK